MSSVPSDSDKPAPEHADANAGEEPQQANARTLLWRALNELSKDYKTVILLRQQMDLTFVEIALALQEREQ